MFQDIQPGKTSNERKIYIYIYRERERERDTRIHMSYVVKFK